MALAERPEDNHVAAASGGQPVPSPVARLDGAPEGLGADGALDAGLDESPTLAEACLALGVSPHVLRRLLDEFGEVLPPMPEEAGERRLAQEAVPALAIIIRMRNAGAGHEDILRALLAQGGLGSAALETAAAGEGHPSTEARLLDQVGRLRDELQRTEERRAEDRDRLLTALMRTNQELRQLRHELHDAPRPTRRGWLRRLFR